MTQDEAQHLINGVIFSNIHKRTMVKYENEGLMSVPDRTSAGRAGRAVDYSVDNVIDFITAWRLLHGKCTAMSFLNLPAFKMPANIISLIRGKIACKGNLWRSIVFMDDDVDDRLCDLQDQLYQFAEHMYMTERVFVKKDVEDKLLKTS